MSIFSPDDISIISKYKLRRAFSFVDNIGCIDHFSTVAHFKDASERLNSIERKQVKMFMESKLQLFNDREMLDVYQKSIDFF